MISVMIVIIMTSSLIWSYLQMIGQQTDYIKSSLTDSSDTSNLQVCIWIVLLSIQSEWAESLEDKPHFVVSSKGP